MCYAPRSLPPARARVPPYCGKAVELGPRENVTNRSSEVDNVYTFSSDEEEAGAVNDVPAATEEEMAMFLEADVNHRQALQERIDELESTNLAALRKVREAEEEAEWYDEALQVSIGNGLILCVAAVPKIPCSTCCSPQPPFLSCRTRMRRKKRRSWNARRRKRAPSSRRRNLKLVTSPQSSLLCAHTWTTKLLPPQQHRRRQEKIHLVQNCKHTLMSWARHRKQERRAVRSMQ